MIVLTLSHYLATRANCICHEMLIDKYKAHPGVVFEKVMTEIELDLPSAARID